MYIPLGLIAAICIYLWACVVFSRATGQMLTVAGVQLAVAPTDISAQLKENTLVGIRPNDGADAAAGDVVMLATDEAGRYQLAQVVAAAPEGVWVKTAADVLPYLIAAPRIVGRAVFTSGALGSVMVFLSTPMGIAAGVLIPIVLLLAVQLVYLLGRKKNAT